MLKVQFKDGRSASVLLSPPGKTIGRGAINDIVIDEDGVNGFHVDLKVEGEQVIISDVNTKSGTRLNGELLLAPKQLRAGDLIEIQGVELDIFDDDITAGIKRLVVSGVASFGSVANTWSLVVNSGSEKGQEIAIRERTCIGRALECDISILEPSLSREHAEIEPVAGKLILRVLDSANASYVNGDKVNEASLEDKDKLSFADMSFIVKAP